MIVNRIFGVSTVRFAVSCSLVAFTSFNFSVVARAQSVPGFPSISVTAWDGSRILATALAVLSQGSINRLALQQLLSYTRSLGFINVNNVSALAADPELLLKDLDIYVRQKNLAPNLNQLPKTLETLLLERGLAKLNINWAEVTDSQTLERELAKVGIDSLSKFLDYAFSEAVKTTGNSEYRSLQRLMELALETLNIQQVSQIPELDRRLRAMGATAFSLTQTVDNFAAIQRNIYLARQTPVFTTGNSSPINTPFELRPTNGTSPVPANTNVPLVNNSANIPSANQTNATVVTPRSNVNANAPLVNNPANIPSVNQTSATVVTPRSNVNANAPLVNNPANIPFVNQTSATVVTPRFNGNTVRVGTGANVTVPVRAVPERATRTLRSRIIRFVPNLNR